MCFKITERNGPDDVTQEVVKDMIKEPEVTLGMSNLQITIIDYTLARAKSSNDAGEDFVIFDPIAFREDNSAEG